MFEFFEALFYFVVFIITFPFLCVLLFIFEVFRQLVRLCLCVKYKRRINFLEAIDCMNVIFGENLEITYAVIMVFRGTPDLEHLKQNLRTKWIDVKHNGQYKHPKLHNVLRLTCGYFYWAPKKNVSVDDHIRMYDGKPPETESQLHDIYSQLQSRDLPKDVLWSITVIPLSDSFAGEKRYVIFSRVHHVMGDGNNVIRLLSQCFLEREQVENIPQPNEEFSLRKFLTQFFYYPKYNMVNQWMVKDFNILHGPEQIKKRIVQMSEPYSLKRIKKIKTAANVTVNDVMMSCVAGAFRRYFSKHNSLPVKDVHVIVPISPINKPGDSEFKHNISYFAAPFAIREKTAMERLKKTNEILNEMKNSEFYYFNYLLMKLTANRLPVCILSAVKHLFNSTTSVSNVPIRQGTNFNEKGHELVEFSAIPQHNVKLAIAFVITSFNGNFKIGVSADQVIMQKEDVSLFLRLLKEELEELEENC